MSFDISQLPAHARLRNPDIFAGTMSSRPSGGAVGVEAELHEDIRKVCMARGWIPLHSRMDAATGRMRGEPDFIILATFPTCYLVECKTRTGKLSPDQVAFAHWAQRLGWTVHVVRSMEDFCRVIEITKETP